MLATGLGALEIMLDEGQRNDWFSSHGIVAAAIIAAIGLIGVVVWELRQKEPVVDFRLLKDRTFAISTASMFVLGFVLYGSTMALPLFLQTLLGYTAMQSGLALSPGGLMIMVMMPIVGILLSKIQARWLIIVGLIRFLAGAVPDVALEYADQLRTRRERARGAKPGAGVPIRAHQHRGVFVHRKAKDRLRHGLDQPGAQHRRKQRHRDLHHVDRAARAIPPAAARRASFSARSCVSIGARQRKANVRDQRSGSAQAAAQAQGMIYNIVQQQAAMLSFNEVFWVLGVAFLAVIPLMFLMKKTGPVKGAIAIE